ncbi:MAG TPA: YdcF family protein [Microthrixaceae bacterium]|nr:YdcF family protein [Microthrixaceae bacterium]
MSKTRAEGSKRTRRSGRRRWVLLGFSAVLLAVVGYLGITALQIVSAAGRDDRGPADAVVVLGAAQYDGRPSPVLRGRLDHALKLYQDGVAPQIFLTGSKRNNDRFTEAYAGYKYLLAAGVPEEDLVIIDDGSTTWESLAAASRVMRREGVKKVVLVSSRYHNRRLQGIASELGLEAGVSPTGGSLTTSQVAGETMRVALGQIVGYRRLYNAKT